MYENNKTARGREYGLVTGALLALTLVMTWPLPIQLFTHLPGPLHQTDTPIYFWDCWWLLNNAATWFPNPFAQQDTIFHPLGSSLAYHTTVFYYAVLAAPAAKLIGLIPAYNLVCLSTFLTSGLAAYLLARYLGLSRYTAFFAAVAFAFSPFRMKRLEQHLCFMQGDLFALYILGLLYLADERRRWWPAGLLCGATFAGAFYCDLTAAVYLSMASILLLALYWRPWRHWQQARRITLGLTLAAVLAAALSSPLLWEIYKVHGTGRFYEEAGHEVGSADLLGFLDPPESASLRQIAGDLVPRIRVRQECVTYIGVLVLALCALGLWFRRGDPAWRYIKLLMVVFLLFSLGPHLKVGANTELLKIPGWEEPARIPMPAALFQLFPVLRNARAAARLHQMTSLGIALLAGLGLSYLMARFRNPRWAYAAGAAALLVCLLEYAVFPCYTHKLNPALFARMGPDDGSVVLDDILNGRRAIEHQVWHGRKTLTGVLSRIPPDVTGYIESTPLLREFSRQETSQEDVKAYLAKPNANRMTANIIDFLDIRHFVINGKKEDYKRSLFEEGARYELLAQDDLAAVYTIARPPRPGIRPQKTTVGTDEWSAYFGRGWGQWRRVTETIQGVDIIWPVLSEATLMFRADTPAALSLALDVYREPASKGVQLQLWANQTYLGTCPVPQDFSTVNCEIPPQAVRTGINHIQLRWTSTPAECPIPRYARALADIVLVSGAAGRQWISSAISINGHTTQFDKRGYWLIEFTGNGRHITRTRNFDLAQNPDNAKAMVAAIDTIAPGKLVAFVSCNEASTGYNPQVRAALATLGSNVDMNGRFAWCHAGIGVKGMQPGQAIEHLSGESAFHFAPARCAIAGFTIKKK